MDVAFAIEGSDKEDPMRIRRMLALGAVLLALVISACTPGGGSTTPSASPAAQKPDITVGSANFDESALVAEIYAQALEAHGYAVERKLELGDRPVLQAALTSGGVNLVPEYLGGLATYLKAEVSSDPQATFDAMQAKLDAEDLIAFDYSPGTDADGWVVRKETADELNLKTMTDIAKVADQLVWGLASFCPTNPDCGPGLKSTYGIDISTLPEVETLSPCSTEMAEALNNSAIDVAQVCTTQPAIQTFNFVLLEDDKGLQPAQNMAPVARKDLADAAPADFADTLNAVSAKLTTDELTKLNVEVSVNQTSFADAATQWLKDQGLI
jgi:osmoprotectant transport system substrate-binding protein